MNNEGPAVTRQLLCSEYGELGRREKKHGCPRRHVKNVLWGQLIEHHSQAVFQCQLRANRRRTGTGSISKWVPRRNVNRGSLQTMKKRR